MKKKTPASWPGKKGGRKRPVDKSDRVETKSGFPIIRIGASGDAKKLSPGVLVHELGRTQEALEKAGGLYRDFYYFSPVGFFTFTRESLIAEANLSGAALLGVPRQKLIRQRFRRFVAKHDLDSWDRHITAAFQQGEKMTCELELIRADGAAFHARLDSVRMDAGGEQVVRTAMIDVTERLQATVALRESEQRLCRLYESGMIGIIYWNINGKITEANDKFLEMLGYTREDLTAGRINGFDMTPPEYRHIDEYSIAELKASGVNRTPFEKEYIRKDGTRIPVILAGAMLNEARTSGIAFVLDNTNRKQAEELLKESEKKYRELFENAMMGISQVLPDGSLINANKAYARMYGYDSPEEMIAEVHNVGRLYANPDDRKEILGILDEKGYMEPKEVSVIRRDGTKFNVLVTAREFRDPDGTVRCLQAEQIDITDRKQVEYALRESQEKYRLIVENSGDNVTVMDMSLNIIYTSPSILKLRGYTSEEVMRQTSDRIIDPKSLDTLIKLFKEQMALEAEGTADPKRSITIEMEEYCKDGSTVWVEDVFSFIRDDNGKPTGIMSVTRDITERKRLEQEIRDKNRFLDSIIEQSPNPILISDKKGTLIRLNKACCDLLKITPEEVVGKYNVLEDNVVIEQEMMPLVRSVFEEGSSVNFDLVYDTALLNTLVLEHSAQVMLNVTIFPIKDDAGRVDNAVIQYIDISERRWAADALLKKNIELSKTKKILEDLLADQDRSRLVLLSILEDEKIARQVLRDSEKKYRTLIETTPSVICRIKHEGTTVFVNDYVKVVTGYASEELVGRNWWDVFYPGAGGEQVALLLDALKQGDVHGWEMTLAARDGSLKILQWESFNQYGTNGELIEINGVGLDVTDRKKTEKALRESEERLRVAMEAAQIGIWDWDLKNDIWRTTPIYYTMLGYDPVEGPSDSTVWLDRVHPEDRAKVEESIKVVLQKKSTEYHYEARLRHANGSYRWINVQGSIVEKDTVGNPTRILGIRMDITDRKLAEEAIRKSERFALSTVNALDANIAILDASGEIISVNSAWRLFAINNMQNPIDVYEGINYLSVCDSARGDNSGGAAEFAAGIRAVINGDRETFSQEYPCHSPSVQRWFIGKVTRFPGKGPINVVVSHTDITELKLAEEKISASLREKEVLLREIHHRVKNNMQVISSLIGLQNSYLTEGVDVRIALHEMQNRIKSMAIVHEKLYRSENLALIEFKEYITSLSTSVIRSLSVDPDRVALRLDVGRVTLGIDAAVPCGLLVNELITNALKHGFPGGRKGVITVTMGVTDDGLCRLSISDNGVGLPAGFDKNSSGSLGLRLVRILTQQLGGTIEVRSAEGVEFIITFPLGKEEKRDEKK